MAIKIVSERQIYERILNINKTIVKFRVACAIDFWSLIDLLTAKDVDFNGLRQSHLRQGDRRGQSFFISEL